MQAAGEGEGLGAWRGLQEQWEPKSRSRFTSMLLGILNGRFKGDSQNDIESWERDFRSFEVLHTSRLDTCEKLRLEVTEIARAKVMSVNPVPMDVDVLRFKGKGKGKTKDHKEKGGTRSKSPDPKDVECFYCGKKGHKKSDCVQRKADLVVLRCLLKVSTRFMKSATLLLELGRRASR